MQPDPRVWRLVRQVGASLGAEDADGDSEEEEEEFAYKLPPSILLLNKVDLLLPHQRPLLLPMADKLQQINRCSLK